MHPMHPSGGSPSNYESYASYESLWPQPSTTLLGDVRIRISNDGGARWSEPSDEPFTCHDAATPPTPLSLSPDAVDVAVGPVSR